MSQQPTTEQTSTAAPRIGARLVVELLRLGLEEPLTDKIALAPKRTKPSLELLKDKLYQIQKTLNVAEMHCSVVSALIERCSDQHIALPVAEPDWGAIQLVDQLFDTLLDEHQLDADAQNWFSQLRVPVIRYVLLDYSFFFAQQNLVRRFLNQAYLALLSSTEKSRKVNRAQLNQFSNRILNEFKKDVGEFNSICIESQTWFAGQNQKVEKIEKQLRNLETARRKEKVAEPRVVQELNRIAAGKFLPGELVDFLHGEWRKSLLLTSMREGDQGHTWKRQLRTTESLIEFAEGCADEQQREKYRSFYPVMMKNLKALLISVDGEELLAAALDPLELVFSAMLNGALPSMEAVPNLKLASGYVTSVEVSKVGQKALDTIESLKEGEWLRMKTGDGSHELCRITLRGQDEEAWVLVSQSGKTVAKKTTLQLAQALEGGVLQVVQKSYYWDHALDNHFQAKYQQWLDIRNEQLAQAKEEQRRKAEEESEKQKIEQQLEVVEQVTESESAQPESKTDDMLNDSTVDSDTEEFVTMRSISEQELEVALQAVDQIQVGGWIIQETSEGEQHCKLAVKIRGHDKLVFVNKLGIKVLEIQRPELAKLVAYGAVTIKDTGTEFDNTLERVVRSIQKDRN